MTGDACAVVATAIPIELQAVREHLSDVKEVTHPRGTIYEVGSFAGYATAWQVVALETGAGNISASLEIERAIGYFHPACVLFVGVAGGLKDVGLGDVVVATKIYDYEAGKAEVDFRPRPNIGESAYELLQLARSVSRRPEEWTCRIVPSPAAAALPEPKAFVGPIAAGEKVVASTSADTYRFLQQYYSDALAVEMEGAGFARAVHANRSLPSLIVRGISDLIDAKGEADAAGSQEVAARRAAAFAFEVLARFQATPADGAAPVIVSATENPNIRDETDPWRVLSDLASKLYPEGPRDRNVWERAGGDLAAIPLGSTGKSEWFVAVREIQRGGGGKVNAHSLLAEIQRDYPNNQAVSRLLAHFQADIS